jgi:hypothetical protein
MILITRYVGVSATSLNPFVTPFIRVNEKCSKLRLLCIVIMQPSIKLSVWVIYFNWSSLVTVEREQGGKYQEGGVDGVGLCCEIWLFVP